MRRLLAAIVAFYLSSSTCLGQIYFQVPIGQGAIYQPCTINCNNQKPLSLASILGVGATQFPCGPYGCGTYSPAFQLLDMEQQETVKELISTARHAGAPESEVSGFVDKYVQQVLPPEKYAAFTEANENFQRWQQTQPIPMGMGVSSFAQFRGKRASKLDPPQKLELSQLGYYDFIEVPKKLRTLDDLVEAP